MLTLFICSYKNLLAKNYLLFVKAVVKIELVTKTVRRELQLIARK